MGSGCLAPKAIQGDLTSQLIQQLHQPPTATNKQEKYMQKETIYCVQKQKIFKMAPLRKLVDYLTSHRHKLIDSLSQNLTLSVQNGTQYSWTVGLAILERIILMATQGTLQQSTSPNISQILRSRPQNGSESEVLREMKTLKTQSEKQNKSNYHILNTQSVSNQIMSPRFESILFDTINSCLEEPSLYKDCLRILSHYLKSRGKSLNNEDKVKNVMVSLLNNIKVDYQGEVTLETYYEMLCKLKDKVVLCMCDELKAIIKLWIQLKNTASSSKSIMVVNGCEAKVSWLELIIARFLTSSLHGMHYSSIIKLLINVQDEHLFDVSLQFESLYVYILQQSELGPHFLKALFLQYLKYAVMGNFGLSVFNQLSEHSRQLLSCNEAVWSNIQSKEGRINLYELIKRWLITDQYISLAQIIAYNSSLFIYCFLPHNTSDSITKNIFADLLNSTNTEQRIILIQAVLELYQRKQSSPYLRNLLSSFQKLIGVNIKSISLKKNISRLAIDTTHLTSSQSNHFYLSLIELYSSFDKQTIALYVQQVCELFASIVSFLHEDTSDKAKLIIALLKFVQLIVSAEMGAVAVASYHQILRVLQRKSLKEGQQQQINRILVQMEEIFKRNQLQDAVEGKPKGDEQAEQNNFGGEYSCYFKQLVNQNSQGKSKLAGTNQFEKCASVIKSEIRDEESIQDILEMINY